MLVDRRRLVKFAGMICLVTVVSALAAVPAAYAFGLENVTAWNWTSDTLILSVAVGDVDGDQSAEIVTGGCYYDGTREVAQLCVWDSSTLALEHVTTWYWTGGTYINSVAIGDVDDDESVEIVTGGGYYDGTRTQAQLCVWDGSTLALEHVTAWYWTSHTNIFSVAVGDVDGDGSVEIVTGGYCDDGWRYYAQLCVWSGATLALEDVTAWYWTSNTYIHSVTVGDVDGDGFAEIVTGGYYNDGTRDVAQLCVWDGATLALEQVTVWYWIDITYTRSVVVGDVDGDQSIEIMTGGYYWDGYRYAAQLCVWSGSTLALEDVTVWYWASDTLILSVAVGDVDGDQSVEIVTGVNYDDGTHTVAQLCVWSGSTLALEDVTVWYWVSRTEINSVAVGDVDGDQSVEIVTGGFYRSAGALIAQLTVWTSA